MSKSKTKFICETNNCNYEDFKYFALCPRCSKYSTAKEVSIESKNKNIRQGQKMSSNESSLKLKDVKSNSHTRLLSNISEFDRVVGGGLVNDSINIITAPPGTGKSTLLLSVFNNYALQGKKVLYIAGEESKEQIKLRADRVLDKVSDNFYIKNETELNGILDEINSLKPDFLFVDSIQTIYNEELSNAPGGDVQILNCVETLSTVAKTKLKMSIFFVGQMTKDDKLMGSRKLEHFVDAVFLLDGEEGLPLRMFRSSKNRFGNTEEVGLFQMTNKGMVEITNPAEYFITKRAKAIEGVAVSMAVEGSRNIAIEIESLCENVLYGSALRVPQGINKGQLQIYSAITQKIPDIDLNQKDVYLKVSGGLKLKNQASSLGIIASLISSYCKIAIPSSYIFLGEVSLTGEIKKIPNIDRIVKEVSRLGFKKLFIPKNNVKLSKYKKEKIEIIEIENINQLYSHLKEL